MPNSASSGIGMHHKSGSPLGRSSSIKKTLTSILGTNSAQKNNNSNGYDKMFDSGSRVNRRGSQPKRSATVFSRPRNGERASHSSASRSSQSAAGSISTGSSSTIDEIPNSLASKRSMRSLHRGGSSYARDNLDSGHAVNGRSKEDRRGAINSVPPELAASGVPPPPSSKEFLREYLTQRGLLLPKTVYERPELKISISSSGDHVFLPTMSCNDDEYLARLNGFREDEDFEILDTAESRARNGSNEELSGSSFDSNLRTRPSTSSFHSTNPFRQTRSTNSSGSRSPPSSQIFEMDESMAPLTIAVIVSIPKPTRISSIEAELISLVRIHWYAGVPPTRSFQDENYSAGTLNWSLGTDNMNLFIPSNVSSKEKIIENNRTIRQMSLFKSLPDNQRIYLEKGRIRKDLIEKSLSQGPQTMQAGDYVYIIPIAFSNHIPESLYLPSARVHYKFCIAAKMQDGKSRSLSMQRQRKIQREQRKEMELNNHKKFGILKKIAGGHIQSTPAPVTDKTEDPNENYTECPIYVIRTPPPISISTANKPIYIDRVWTDSLAYEVSFAQKYVALGSKVPIKIKLEPLSPDVFVKRIRVSIVEKITFVSKNYEFEYDQVDPVARDPYNPYFNEFAAKRKKERSLSLLEVRTRDKGGRAIKEEIVDNCIDDNLLAYNPEGGVDPLYIETNVEFPRYEDLERNVVKQLPPYGVDAYTNVPNAESINAQSFNNQSVFHSPNNSTLGRRNSVIGFLSHRRSSLSPTPRNSMGDLRRRPSFPSHPVTNKSSSPPADKRFYETKLRSGRGVTVRKHTRLNKPRRGLYLDSLHFTNIHSRHKLEVMLRISKPDNIDPTKLRHYEVLIDTPIFLISEKCSEGNMELPTYSDAINDPLSPGKPPNLAALPSFEEAISVPASPIQSPLGSPAGSPMGSPHMRSINVTNDSDIQHLNLPSTPASASPENASNVHSSSASGVSANLANDNYMFNNLDRLMSSPVLSADKSNADGHSYQPNSFQGTNNLVNSEDLEMARPKFGKSPEALTAIEKSKRTLSSEPPKYDEIIP